MSEIPKLTGPQLMFLMDLSEFKGVQGMYVHETYKPAQKLTELGLARWRRENMIEITDAGREMLKHPVRTR